MTAQEAIKVLEVFTTEKFQCLTSSEFDDAICCAIEALEKQIPKKVVKVKIPNTSFCKASTRYKCPSCGSISIEPAFPCKCGQKLDCGD